jgi:hypothetical protein
VSRPEDAFCEACSRDVIAIRPHWGWRAASFAAFPTLAAILAVASALLILGSGIFVLVVGMMIVGPLNERASARPLCPSCRCAVAPLRRRRREGGSVRAVERA